MTPTRTTQRDRQRGRAQRHITTPPDPSRRPLLPHAKAIWHSEMMAYAEATCTPTRYFNFVGTDNRNGDIFLPVFFAAFGTECVEALRNIGPIRKVA